MAPARQPFSTLSPGFRNHPQDRVSTTAVSTAGSRKLVSTNWTHGTGGANGLPGVPMSERVAKERESTSNVAGFCVGGIVGSCLGVGRAMLAPFGRLLRAIREDKLAAAVARKSVPRARALAAVPAGAFAEPAGGLDRTFSSFTDLSVFDFDSSIPGSSMVLLTMAVVCGARAVAGSIDGPFMRLGLPRILTLVDIATEIATAVRRLILGVLLIGFTPCWPPGLAGEKP
jgi:branched-chain amino acid transport system permease protein